MSSSEESAVWKFVCGLVTGVVLTFLYVRFGIQAPGAIGLGQKLTTEAVVKTAEMDLYNARQPPIVRRRALAVVLANRPELFLEVDQRINNTFFNAFLQHTQRQDQPGRIDADAIGTTRLIGSSGSGTFQSVRLDSQSIHSLVRDPSGKPIGIGIPTSSILEGRLRKQFPEASEEVIRFLADNHRTLGLSLAGSADSRPLGSLLPGFVGQTDSQTGRP